jgi:hypothetical protein
MAAISLSAAKTVIERKTAVTLMPNSYKRLHCVVATWVPKHKRNDSSGPAYIDAQSEAHNVVATSFPRALGMVYHRLVEEASLPTKDFWKRQDEATEQQQQQQQQQQPEAKTTQQQQQPQLPQDDAHRYAIVTDSAGSDELERLLFAFVTKNASDEQVHDFVTQDINSTAKYLRDQYLNTRYSHNEYVKLMYRKWVDFRWDHKTTTVEHARSQFVKFHRYIPRMTTHEARAERMAKACSIDKVTDQELHALVKDVKDMTTFKRFTTLWVEALRNAKARFLRHEAQIKTLNVTINQQVSQQVKAQLAEIKQQEQLSEQKKRNSAQRRRTELKRRNQQRGLVCHHFRDGRCPQGDRCIFPHVAVHEMCTTCPDFKSALKCKKRHDRSKWPNEGFSNTSYRYSYTCDSRFIHDGASRTEQDWRRPGADGQQYRAMGVRTDLPTHGDAHASELVIDSGATLSMVRSGDVQSLEAQRLKQPPCLVQDATGNTTRALNAWEHPSAGVVMEMPNNWTNLLSVSSITQTHPNAACVFFKDTAYLINGANALRELVRTQFDVLAHFPLDHNDGLYKTSGWEALRATALGRPSTHAMHVSLPHEATPSMTDQQRDIAARDALRKRAEYSLRQKILNTHDHARLGCISAQAHMRSAEHNGNGSSRSAAQLRHGYVQCPHCALSKGRNPAHPKRRTPRATHSFQRLSADLIDCVGAVSVAVAAQSLNNPAVQALIKQHKADHQFTSYVLVVLDERSGAPFVGPLCSKSKESVEGEFVSILQHMQALAKQHMNMTADDFKHAIQQLRTDQGKEFINRLFAKLCAKGGITHTTSQPSVHQQNGAVERIIRTLTASARALLHTAPAREHMEYFVLRYWYYAVRQAAFLYNNTAKPYLHLDGIVAAPIDQLLGKSVQLGTSVANLKHIQLFGSFCWVTIAVDAPQRQAGGKFGPRKYRAIYVGHGHHPQEYRGCLVHQYDEQKRVTIGRVRLVDEKFVTFDEHNGATAFLERYLLQHHQQDLVSQQQQLGGAAGLAANDGARIDYYEEENEDDAAGAAVDQMILQNAAAAAEAKAAAVAVEAAAAAPAAAAAAALVAVAVVGSTMMALVVVEMVTALLAAALPPRKDHSSFKCAINPVSGPARGSSPTPASPHASLRFFWASELNPMKKGNGECNRKKTYGAAGGMMCVRSGVCWPEV